MFVFHLRVCLSFPQHAFFDFQKFDYYLILDYLYSRLIFNLLINYLIGVLIYLEIINLI